MKTKLLFVAAIALALSSCKNLVPFTDAMKTKHKWGEEQIKRIQFYVSRDIILQHEITSGSTNIVRGVIKTLGGKKMEEILIREGTPGVVTQIPKEKKMLVSFEMGDNYTLSFGVNPGMGEKYVLLASDWSNGVGKVHYGGEEFWTDPDSKYACLLVDIRKIEKMELKQRIASGRKVN